MGAAAVAEAVVEAAAAAIALHWAALRPSGSIQIQLYGRAWIRHIPTNLLLGLRHLSAGTNDIAGEDNAGGIALSAGALSASLQSAFPQFATATALTLPSASAAQVNSLLPDQLAIVQYSNSTPTNGTQVQIGPALDSQYGTAAASATLGVSFNPATDVPTFQVWAPTATSVQLNLYPSAGAMTATEFAMTEIRARASGATPPRTRAGPMSLTTPLP